MTLKTLLFITDQQFHITVTCESDYRRGVGFDIRFIDHFNTKLIITLNYKAIANFHTLQINITHTHTHTHTSVLSVTKRFLVTASNNGYSSAFRLQSSLNGGSLPTELFSS
jgi:hypothetical protein